MNIRAGFLYTVSKYGDIPTLDQIMEALSKLRDLGYICCELEGRDPDHLELLVNNKEKLMDHCKFLGMEVINFVMMLPGTSSLDPEERDHAVEQFIEAADLAEYFGCLTMEMDTYPARLVYDGDPMEPEKLKTKVLQDYDWEGQWQALVDIVKMYSKIAADVGCKLQLHARIGELVSNTDGMMLLWNAVQDDNLGFVFDTAQLHAQKEILPLSVEKLHDAIWCLHVSDNDGCTHLHQRLGQGTVDWEGLFAALSKHSFDWNIAVDVANYGTIDEDYRSSRQFLDEMAMKTGII